MTNNRSGILKSEFVYISDLVRAAIQGAVSTPIAPTLPASRLAPGVWAGAISGATLGILSTCWRRKPARAPSAFAWSCVIGSAIGSGTILAWQFRNVAGPTARNAIREVNAVRDAHWLEKNPIAYA